MITHRDMNFSKILTIVLTRMLGRLIWPAHVFTTNARAS